MKKIHQQQIEKTKKRKTQNEREKKRTNQSQHARFKTLRASETLKSTSSEEINAGNDWWEMEWTDLSVTNLSFILLHHVGRRGEVGGGGGEGAEGRGG